MSAAGPYSDRLPVATIDADGHRLLLGKRQRAVLARRARARIQESQLQQPSAAVRSAGAQVAAHAGDELSRQAAGAARQRLRGVRVAGDTLLPRAEIPRAADLRSQSARGRGDHARDLRVPVLRRAAIEEDRLRLAAGPRTEGR